MPGGIIRLKHDLVVDDIPERAEKTENWNASNKGQGVLVINAYKDYPDVGEGDATVGTAGSYGYYKWTGSAFVKISEGESIDVITIILKGEWDASGNLFPEVPAVVAVNQGFQWRISEGGDGVLGGRPVGSGAKITALIDNPGQDLAGWDIDE